MVNSPLKSKLVKLLNQFNKTKLFNRDCVKGKKVKRSQLMCIPLRRSIFNMIFIIIIIMEQISQVLACRQTVTFELNMQKNVAMDINMVNYQADTPSLCEYLFS